MKMKFCDSLQEAILLASSLCGPRTYSQSLITVVFTDFTSLELSFYIGTVCNILVNKWAKSSFIVVLEYGEKKK